MLRGSSPGVGLRLGGTRGTSCGRLPSKQRDAGRVEERDIRRPPAAASEQYSSGEFTHDENMPAENLRAPGVRYEIRSGNTRGVFSLDRATGALQVAGKLDYETQSKYELRVAASDGASENHALVAVRVLDVNDNPPLFERPSYRTQITEEDDRNLPKRVLQVTAIDGDKDHPESIVYFLTGQGIDADTPENSKFDINQTSGEIFVLKPLDRDLPHGRPQWRFTVFAQDEGGEGLVGYADVQVNLKDINDNAPVFPHGVYFGKVTENGTRGMAVMTIAAVDHDDPQEGANAQLSYSIEKNVIEEETGLPIFEIEPATGLIRTAVCCLDRERTPDYSIQVVAVDGGGLKGTGTASIRVEDINDMPPVFTRDEWLTEADETDGDHVPDVPILTVTVHDQDEVNDFHYQVVANSGFGAEKFLLVKNNDGTGSLKVAQPLDFEDSRQRNGFRFRIQVTDKRPDDGDDTYHVAYSWVVVSLRDINDNKPQFERPDIEVSVYENAAVGRNLVTFSATDPDQGGKSAVAYKIDPASDQKRQFAIDEEGSVSVQRSLDHEKLSTHKVRILAVDDGIPSQTATATLTVLVQDINDNAPTLLKDYRPVLPENHPPRIIAELQATDRDDRSKKNGPPFVFKMDPTADDIIKASFKVDHDPRGASGDGAAVVSSLRSFDREQQKNYLIPVVIRDSGTPSLTSTCTLTVVIGDVNDNTMQPDYKHVVVYNYLGQAGDSAVGRVHVRDLDDWDLPDKQFQWSGQEHPLFALDQHSGMVTMRRGTPSGRYNLQFKVSDRKHGQYDVPANVTVTVRDISHEAVVNSGSVRLAGVTDEDFIAQSDAKGRSRLDRLRDKLAEVLRVGRQDVLVFSVQASEAAPRATDVRFAARVSGARYLPPVRLNGLLLMHREAVESHAGVNITQVGPGACLAEGRPCAGSCTAELAVGAPPHLVDANRTALVGVTVRVAARCVCGARHFAAPETCLAGPCLNGGSCSEEPSGVSCSCPAGLDGPACQETARSFNGDGWAWFPHLEMCEQSHLSFEFITKKPDGLLLYNGPLVAPEPEEILISDFISLELDKGGPRLLVDFGSGTLELKVRTKNSLDDGKWHRIDVFWDTQDVQLMVDLCRAAAVLEAEDAPLPRFDGASCLARGAVPPFDEQLNVNTPLQLGGLHVAQFDPQQYRWQAAPHGRPFHGCIRNLVHNSKLYDMQQPGLSRGSEAGCAMMSRACGAQCRQHGSCEGGLSAPRCLCSPGWTGPDCVTRTVPATFKELSYVKYALSFEPDRFLSRTQLRFRTRELGGELLRLSDQHGKEYAVLEITGGHLHFRYNLNSVRTEEQDLALSAVPVHDGKWHIIKVTRYGSAAMLELDGGEGRRFNETLLTMGHQWLLVDKQEGVYVGGKAEFTGVRTFEVYADYKQGCLDDVRLDGKPLPLPPAANGTQWGQATTARHLERGCASSRPCDGVACPEPFQCRDLWNQHECACAEGHVMAADGKGCVDRNECLDKPCLNGGVCVNQSPPPGYRCLCPQRFWGGNCEAARDARSLRLGVGFLAAILLCLLVIAVLVFVFVLYNRRRQSRAKYPKTEEDVRENIISYDDEGGGEDDMMAFDIKPLQIPVEGAVAEGSSKEQQIPLERIINISAAIEQYRKAADGDQNAPPFDDLRNFAFEGGGSTSGSLSSLATETEENDQDFEYLNAWGPRFSVLSSMYRDEETSEETQ